MKYAYAYVFDTLADWELGYIVAELNSGRYFKKPGEHLPVRTVGLTKDPITTQGGMTIMPDATVADVTAETSAVLLLAGGAWDESKHKPVIMKAKELLVADANVAAICGATGVLASAGLFDRRPHTSNAPEYLELTCPNYKGREFSRDARAVADGNLITASSAGPLLWARYILARLDVFAEETLVAWYHYFDTGEASYFFEMMQTLPQGRASDV